MTDLQYPIDDYGQYYEVEGLVRTVYVHPRRAIVETPWGDHPVLFDPELRPTAGVVGRVRVYLQGDGSYHRLVGWRTP